MTNGDALKNNFPGCWNKEGTIFSAMIANSKRTGAIESILDDAEQYAKEYTETPNVYEQTGSMLETTISFFSYLEKITNETDTSFKQRFKALFVRNHDEKWGSLYNIKNVFRQYFSLANVFVCENTNDLNSENLIHDFDFSTDFGYWNYEGNAEKKTEARFSKSYGVYLPQGIENSLSQEISNLETGTYFLHVMVKGKCLSTCFNGSQYWNPETRRWEDDICYIPLESDGWGARCIWFENANIHSIKLTFYGSDIDTYMDYFRLFEKKDYPSFTVITQFTGTSIGSEMMLAPEKNAIPDDDNGSRNIDYDKARYFGISENNRYNEKTAFLTGVQAGFAQEMYEELLDYMKPVGVQAYLEIVNRDYVEGE